MEESGVRHGTGERDRDAAGHTDGKIDDDPGRRVWAENGDDRFGGRRSEGGENRNPGINGIRDLGIRHPVGGRRVRVRSETRPGAVRGQSIGKEKSTGLLGLGSLGAHGGSTRVGRRRGLEREDVVGLVRVDGLVGVDE